MSSRYSVHHWFIYVHYTFFPIDTVFQLSLYSSFFSLKEKKKTGLQLLHTAGSVSAVQQSQSALCIQIYLFWGFLSHLGHHRAPSRVPCAKQQVLISYIFYIQQCIYVSPNLPVHSTAHFPLQYPYICSLHLCLQFCFVSKTIYTIFLDSKHTS